MTERVRCIRAYKHLDDYVSHNLIPNSLPNGKDWHHFMILEVVFDLAYETHYTGKKTDHH